MHLYRTIFTEEFNFGFGLPWSNTCARCDALSIAIKSTCGDDLGRLRREQAKHHMHADAGYSNKLREKKAAVQSWSRKSPVIGGEVPYRRINVVDMITFDFQQNLPMPTFTILTSFSPSSSGLTTSGSMIAWPTRATCSCGTRLPPSVDPLRWPLAYTSSWNTSALEQGNFFYWRGAFPDVSEQHWQLKSLATQVTFRFLWQMNAISKQCLFFHFILYLLFHTISRQSSITAFFVRRLRLYTHLQF